VTDGWTAYVAGFFDGEGCIQLVAAMRSHRNGKSYPRFQLHVSVTQYDPEPLYLMKELFGGNVYQRKSRATKSGKMHHRFDWVATSQVAAQFLAHIRPYLITKAQEADIAIEFAATMGSNSGDTRNGIPQEVVRRRFELVEQIKEVRENKIARAYEHRTEKEVPNADVSD
jgi:hypothetical protein